MQDKPLHIYLDDHLALLVGERELAARCHRNNQHPPWEVFLKKLEQNLPEHEEILRDVIGRVGREGLESLAKQGAAWFTEKLGRFKPNDSLLKYSNLSRVVEFETLAAAAQERIALWDSIAAVSNGDRRLDKFDFPWLCSEAEDHLKELNALRRIAAKEAFLSDSVS